MNLKKAIEDLENALADKWCPWSPELQASIQLGIEALKRQQVRASLTYADMIRPLPGETNA